MKMNTQQSSLLRHARLLPVAMLACACTQTDIVGEWTQPVPGMEDMTQGFALEQGGTASSINMATLQYEKWERQGDLLILSGKSIGNGQAPDFSDTLRIDLLTDTELTLTRGNLTLKYTRQ